MLAISALAKVFERKLIRMDSLDVAAKHVVIIDDIILSQCSRQPYKTTNGRYMDQQIDWFLQRIVRGIREI